MSKDSPDKSEKVLSRWDWTEGAEESPTTDESELLPPITESPASAHAPAQAPKTLFGHPLERRRARGWTKLQTALERVRDAILHRHAVYVEALTLASVWREWLEPFELALPVLPVLPVERPAPPTSTGWLEYQALETRLGELKGHLNLLARSRTKDATAVVDACQGAADAFLTLLQVFHLAPSEARAAEADELVLSTPTEGANSAPEIPLKRQIELGWTALAGAFAMLESMRSARSSSTTTSNPVYEAALKVATVWRKWVGPLEELELPVLPVCGTDVTHADIEESRAFSGVWERLLAAKHFLDYVAYHRLHDNMTVVEELKMKFKLASEAWLHWLGLVGMVSEESGAAVAPPTAGPEWGAPLPRVTLPSLEGAEMVATKFAQLELARQEGIGDDVSDCAHEVAAALNQWASEGTALPRFCVPKALGGWDLLPWFHTPGQERDVEDNLFWVAFEAMRNAESAVRVALEHGGVNQLNVLRVKQSFVRAASAWLNWLSCMNLVPEAEADQEATRLETASENSLNAKTPPLPTRTARPDAARSQQNVVEPSQGPVTLPAEEGWSAVFASVGRLYMPWESIEAVNAAVNAVAEQWNRWVVPHHLEAFIRPKGLSFEGFTLDETRALVVADPELEPLLARLIAAMFSVKDLVRDVREVPFNKKRLYDNLVAAAKRASAAWLEWLEMLGMAPEKGEPTPKRETPQLVMTPSPSGAIPRLSPRALGVQQGIDPLDGSADIAADMLERHMPGSTHQERLEAVFSARPVSLVGWTPPAPLARVASPTDEKSGWEMVGSPEIDEAPPRKNEHRAALEQREKRLWEQLRTYDWSFRGRRSFVRRRQEAAAFERKQARILAEQKETELAGEALRFSVCYQKRAELARGDREIRLALLRFWVMDLCELHGWPLPSFEKTPSNPPTPRGPVGAQDPGPRGEGVAWIDTDLRFGAANVPSAFVDEDSDAWNLQSELAEGQDEHTPAAVVYELDGDDPADHYSPSRLASLLQANGLEPFDGLPENPDEEELEDADFCPLEDSEVSPLQDVPTELRSLVAATAPVGTGLRQARALMQWFSPVLLAVLLVGCAHEPHKPVLHLPTSSVPGPSASHEFPNEFPPDCAQLAIECTPQYIDPHLNLRVVKYCRSRGYRLEQCLW